MNQKQRPKAFISYSQTSEAHKTRVREFADQLVKNGVQVILDQYDLREGDDIHAFMEISVNDPTVTKVIVVCDQRYADKADGREGGVGIESTIMSKDVYNQVSGQINKIVAVIFECNDEGNPCLPTMLHSKKYIDMSTPDLEVLQFEQLIRFLVDQPELIKPTLGQLPNYLSNNTRAKTSTAVEARALILALENGEAAKIYRRVNNYFDAIDFRMFIPVNPRLENPEKKIELNLATLQPPTMNFANS